MRILRQRQVCEKIGYSPMHIWRLEKARKFPRRVKLGPNSVGWIAEEIDEWIAARIAERDGSMQKRTLTPVDDESRFEETSGQ